MRHYQPYQPYQPYPCPEREPTSPTTPTTPTHPRPCPCTPRRCHFELGFGAAARPPAIAEWRLRSHAAQQCCLVLSACPSDAHSQGAAAVTRDTYRVCLKQGTLPGDFFSGSRVVEKKNFLVSYLFEINSYVSRVTDPGSPRENKVSRYLLRSRQDTYPSHQQSTFSRRDKYRPPGDR